MSGAAVHVRRGPFCQHAVSVLRLFDIKKDIAPLIIKLILDFLNYLFFSKFPFFFSHTNPDAYRELISEVLKAYH